MKGVVEDDEVGRRTGKPIVNTSSSGQQGSGQARPRKPQPRPLQINVAQDVERWHSDESGTRLGLKSRLAAPAETWSPTATAGGLRSSQTTNQNYALEDLEGPGDRVPETVDRSFDDHEGRYEQLWREGHWDGSDHRVPNGNKTLNCLDVLPIGSRDAGSPSRPAANSDFSRSPRADNTEYVDQTFLEAEDIHRTNHPNAKRQTSGVMAVPRSQFRQLLSRFRNLLSFGNSGQGQESVSSNEKERLQASSKPSIRWPTEEEIEAKQHENWAEFGLAAARLVKGGDHSGILALFGQRKAKNVFPGSGQSSEDEPIIRNYEPLEIRREFIMTLAKALIQFGAPPHRIESQLIAADTILHTNTLIYLPDLVIIAMHFSSKNNYFLDNARIRTQFIRAKGRIALTSLQTVHGIYREVLHDHISCRSGIVGLIELMEAPPIYSLSTRIYLSFICSAIICVLSFGGATSDMIISGFCAAFLQYLGLSKANKSTLYANVYEISITIFVAFVARGLSSIPGHIFCYSAISSAGVVLILPGFTVLLSALELMSKSLFCGSVRMVYAVIYTLFLGFGLTMGSDFYFVFDSKARARFYNNAVSGNFTYYHGQFVFANSSTPFDMVSGIIGIAIHQNDTASGLIPLQVVKGCLRNSSWSWWHQPWPRYSMFILVPLYSLCSSLQNLQAWRSFQLLIMVFFSCCSFAANQVAAMWLPGRTEIVAAAGAFIIGLLGNIYSRLQQGTAFTSMVTGVLFLVPSGISQRGGLTQAFHNVEQQYSNGISLAVRMVSLASGVTIGLLVSQFIVYVFGQRKKGAHFAF